MCFDNYYKSQSRRLYMLHGQVIEHSFSIRFLKRRPLPGNIRKEYKPAVPHKLHFRVSSARRRLCVLYRYNALFMRSSKIYIVIVIPV